MTSACLVVSRDVLDAAFRHGSCQVFGRVHVGEGLVQILSESSNSALDNLGRFTLTQSGASPTVPIRAPHGEVFFAPDVAMPVFDAVDIIDVAAGLDSRRTQLGPGLAEKSVLLVGAGSVGSVAGLLLAQAGVGRFAVIDNDRLEPANLSRHACGLEDLLRRKAKAVADLLRRRAVQVVSHDLDIVDLASGDLDELVGAVDLVLATTDSPAAQFVTNEACVRMKRQAVFAGAYERAAAGEVVAYRPGTGPCLFCAVGFRVGAAPSLIPHERREAYQDADQNRLIAEPGLGVDTAFLSTVAAAVALSLLDPSGSRAGLVAPGSFLLLHGGSAPREQLAEVFDSPFEFISARVMREDPCPICAFQPAQFGS